MKKKSKSPVRSAPRASAAADLLFEIGTEELPAAYLPSLIAQLKEQAQQLLAAQHLSFRSIQTFGTPRRLVLLMQGLQGIQRTPELAIRGPSAKAAYDLHGKPTPALEGFVRSQGGALAQVKVASSEKGEYVYLLKPPTTTPTTNILPQLLSQLIQKLRAPKTMRWDASGVRFARPIRWLVALYGTKPLHVTFGALTSKKMTWVGAPLRPKKRSVTSIASYLLALKRQKVLLEQDQRRVWIKREVNKIAALTGGRIAPEMISHGLLDEVTYLVEQPVSLVGRFDQKYLVLPREVLLASMAKHQRVFAVDFDGKLVPQCIAILEGKPGDPALVRKTLERILNARLADSLLFLKQDQKKSISAMASGLSGVTFHEKLGSMGDKTQRLHRLTAVLEEAWKLNQTQTQQLRRACELAKADLVSTMVREFPTLQGVMGKYYAIDSKESREVAEAIEEHYLPVGGKAPKTLLGQALSILDKFDTLSSYFGIGIEPTGDQDPYGLRRAAQGIVEVAWMAQRPVPLPALLEARMQSAPFGFGVGRGPATAAELVMRVTDYILERLYTFEWPAPVPSHDVIEAVLSRPAGDLVENMNRIVSLQSMNGSQALTKAAKVVERTGNMLKSAPDAQPNVDVSLLKEPPEHALWKAYDENKSRVEELIRSRCYAEATQAYGEVFYEPLHQFFDHVMVNVKEESIRRNRLALMKAIHTLYTERLADLSKLSILHTEVART